jgi:hypothetical protein
MKSFGHLCIYAKVTSKNIIFFSDSVMSVSMEKSEKSEKEPLLVENTAINRLIVLPLMATPQPMMLAHSVRLVHQRLS